MKGKQVFARESSIFTDLGRIRLPKAAGGAARSTAAVIKTEYVGRTPLPAQPRAAELATLRAAMSSLQQRVQALEAQVAPEVNVRDVPIEQAKAEILNYFRKNPGAYPSDAAVALSLDPAVARDLSLALIGEGKLEG